PAKINNLEEKLRIFIVYVDTEQDEDAYNEAEFEGLVEAAGAVVAGSARQRVDHVKRALYIGSGKVEEIKEAAAETDADCVVFDCELSGIQIRNIEKIVEKPVYDRTQLILDIFASRAHTREGMLQVELALYTYRLP